MRRYPRRHAEPEIVKAIRELTAEYGYPPTMREVATRVGVSSSDTIYQRLKMLRTEGLITWEEGKPRTLRLIPQGES